ncbi:ABC transporter permease [Marinitenerispora sediminis]|uniref:Peptide ABC transporter permease n=1 Tax=Marinitenerispora sediminis TaxID=1931232 RepID=A0A368T8P9_9ACTN|nr:ABC transporter permease [Marinitenerispora sediminis]RCV55055.1 peptide ABC transporter permease [Marinitenerispora sediminis]RCV58020.1 peptide ABC transporter permease [Marinitenerispora sediminis]RCV60701.1 peptide ABC transporter permease [Marinitenerispora sediminis]
MTTLGVPEAALRAAGPRWRVPPAPVLAGTVLLLFAVVAARPEWFAVHSPTASDLGAALRPPGPEHPFGTDQLGRDVFARVAHGAWPSLSIGVGATALGVLLGTAVGSVSAFGGRLLDRVMMRAVDVGLAFPELLLALIVLTVLGPGPVNVLVAIGLAAAPGYARLVRSRVLVVRESAYVQAAVVMGIPRPLIVLRHVLPNTLGPVSVLATISAGTAIVLSAGLSFLGFGPQPPAAEWGLMLSEGRDHLQRAWWIAVFPGAAVTTVVVAVTVVGRWLKARLDGGPQ